MEIVFKFFAPLNAFLPIFFTVDGNVTEQIAVDPALLSSAFSPTAVTV